MSREFHNLQLRLDGMEPVECIDVLFFAILPAPDVAAHIHELTRTVQHQHALRGKPLGMERLHISLCNLWDHAGLPQSLIDAAQRVGERMEAAAFDVTFDLLSSFDGNSQRHPLVLLGSKPRQRLRALRQQLWEKALRAGLGKHTARYFEPHITMMYANEVLESQPIAPISWEVQEFVLIHSLMGRTEYRILGRWPLRPSPGQQGA